MKLTREDWLSQGMQVLAEHGPEAIKIDRLCGYLKVTKGSFYHYFANRGDFLDALLVYWQTHYTEDIIRAVADIADPAQRSEQLSAEITAIPDRRPEVVLRSWSLQEPKIAVVVARVDHRRLTFLTELIAAQVGSVAKANLIAKVVYAHFVGCQYLGDLVDDAECQEMDQLLRTMVRQFAESFTTGDGS